MHGQQTADQCAREHREDRPAPPQRRPAGAAGDARLGRDRRQREREDGRREVRHRDGAGDGVLPAERRREQHDHDVPAGTRDRLVRADRGEQRQGEEDDLGRDPRPREGAPVRGPPAEDPTEGRADEERPGRGERRTDRQARRAREREPEQHDVAGHVRDEDVTERDVAHRVDDPGHRGESEEQERQRAVVGVWGHAPGPPGGARAGRGRGDGGVAHRPIVLTGGRGVRFAVRERSSDGLAGRSGRPRRRRSLPRR